MTGTTAMAVEAEILLEAWDEAFAVIGALTDEQANRRPDLPGANSAFAIGTHLLGVAPAWLSTVARGVPVPRDREAEFSATGRVADLVAEAQGVRAFIVDAVATLDPDAAPAAPVDWTDALWSRSNRGLVQHVLKECTQHLGQLEITRDLVTA